MNSLKYSINASITLEAAARLFILNNIDIRGHWDSKQANALMGEIGRMGVPELLHIIDSIEPQAQIDSSLLPQFGSLEMLIRVPEVLISTGIDGLSYAQLGFYLKGDINAKQGANVKYGETHGKGAWQLGFAECRDGKIHFCSLTNAFCEITDTYEKLRISKLLCFRMPIIQTLLNQARDQKVNGFHPMSHLEKSTQIRRGSCVKMVLRELQTLGNSELSKRIENIYWDIEMEDSANA